MQIGPRADVPEWNNQGQGVGAGRSRRRHRSGRLGDLLLLHPRQGARQGHEHRLVEGGIEFARQNGARLVEACPIDLSSDSRSIGLFVGSSRVFEKAGFERLVERKAGRPLMRLVL